jgi:lipopolysaccharide transport protein LptA
MYMATSCADARLPRLCRGIATALAAVAAVGLLTGATGTIGGGTGKMPVNWTARKVEMNYKAHVMHLSGDVKIVRGDLSVAADEAEATSESQDFKDSHWVFTGKVHVRTESQGDLHADRTTLEITKGELTSARVTGSPAQFEQTRSKSGTLATGHANTVDYDVVRATVKLTGDPWLSYSGGQNVMNAPAITYNVRDQEIQGEGDSNSTGGAHVIITPKTQQGTGTDPKP